MKKHFLGLSLAVFALSALAWASTSVRGEYQGVGFTTAVEPMQAATVYWDDGVAGFTGYYNPNPNPAPRCPCEVYEYGGRRVDVERSFNGGYSRAYYSNRGGN